MRWDKSTIHILMRSLSNSTVPKRAKGYVLCLLRLLFLSTFRGGFNRIISVNQSSIYKISRIYYGSLKHKKFKIRFKTNWVYINYYSELKIIMDLYIIIRSPNVFPLIVKHKRKCGWVLVDARSSSILLDFFDFFFHFTAQVSNFFVLV